MKSRFLSAFLILGPALLLACDPADDPKTNESDAATQDQQSPDAATPDASDTDGATNDAASDAACSRGAVSFACGTATCTAAKPICCNDHATCVADASQCPKEDGGITPRATIECDDADDCGDGKVCCSSFNKGNNFTDYFCKADCSQVAYGGQVCKQTCECLGGKTCTNGGCE